MTRRQQDFRRAAEFLSEAFAAIEGVERVTLFGSVAVPLQRGPSRHRSLRRFGDRVPHECQDVDLAVHLRDLGGLPELHSARSQALKRLLARTGIGVAHHQVDVFLFDDQAGRDLGRLCCFRECPADEPACRVPGCGDVAHLQQHEDFTLRAEARAPSASVVLHDTCPF